ncbi:hypothetical protein ADIWIN_1425 [Winogradskyella psychrotolerans RS-3]|uniref:Uncharacterized protein n=1 Tax=Winogradskyella psychrotolerans RS-3 TaxID=641526 RepID=S7VT20_9FLAO|nr:hypothetical protein ADIWIN_1425 [Winogradskyella psychrotolerans RS-3]
MTRYTTKMMDYKILKYGCFVVFGNDVQDLLTYLFYFLC